MRAYRIVASVRGAHPTGGLDLSGVCFAVDGATSFRPFTPLAATGALLAVAGRPAHRVLDVDLGRSGQQLRRPGQVDQSPVGPDGPGLLAVPSR